MLGICLFSLGGIVRSLPRWQLSVVVRSIQLHQYGIGVFFHTERVRVVDTTLTSVNRFLPSSAACGANTYSFEKATTCKSCLTGSASSSGASICTCTAGYFSDTGFSTVTACTGTGDAEPGPVHARIANVVPRTGPGIAHCTVCPKNSFSSSSGSTSCTACSAGFVTSTSGQTSASECTGAHACAVLQSAPVSLICLGRRAALRSCSLRQGNLPQLHRPGVRQ